MRAIFLIPAILLLGCGQSVNVSDLYIRGVKEYQEKRFEDAEKSFRGVIDADDDFLNAYLMLAKIYYYNRDYSRALESVDEILERDGDHAGALYWKARCIVMSNREKTDEPVELLKRVLETDSGHIPARLLLSLLYEKQGSYKEALHEYITVLGEEENLISARGNLAILYMRLGLKERAKSEIDKALKISEITGSGVKNIKMIKSEFDKWEE